LYNGSAVLETQICPNSWHVPTDSEWTQLTDFLGGEGVAGEVMKSGQGYYYDPDDANSSGFTGLPGGYRNYHYFVQENSEGYFWSSSLSANGNYLWNRRLSVSSPGVDRQSQLIDTGLSARCVQD
jgi:uncharacterized protein (TIGR02145 family)